METKNIFKISSKIRKIVQLSGVKRAIIRCFYTAKNDLVAVPQKIVQISGTCYYPACNYPQLLYSYFSKSFLVSRKQFFLLPILPSLQHQKFHLQTQGSLYIYILSHMLFSLHRELYRLGTLVFIIYTLITCILRTRTICLDF